VAIVSKFKLAQDLANACQISLHHLLERSPSKTISSMVFYLGLNANTIGVIHEFLGIPFFLNSVFPRSWFYIIKSERFSLPELLTGLFKI